MINHDSRFNRVTRRCFCEIRDGKPKAFAIAQNQLMMHDAHSQVGGIKEQSVLHENGIRDE